VGNEPCRNEVAEGVGEERERRPGAIFGRWMRGREGEEMS
jgi:hypothetical protein